jgi:hypothetical protein
MANDPVARRVLRALPIAVTALAVAAVATTTAGQIIKIRDIHRPAPVVSTCHPHGGKSGSGPYQYCTQCQIPKNLSLNKPTPDAICFNHDIACMCAPPGGTPTKSDQPLCLYNVTPPAPGQPQDVPHYPLKVKNC